MINQKNTALWFKLNGLLRYVLMHTATRAFPLYVVNEYPRSGGTWVGEMLSDALGVPFPRNRLPMMRSSILHGHVMQSWNMHNVLIVWRDGRDVLVSQYFYSLFKNDRGNELLVNKWRRDLGFRDYREIHANLPKFMEYVYEKKGQSGASWAEFVTRWADCKRCVHVRYEDLKLRPAEELRRIAAELAGHEIGAERAAEIVEKNSFERLSGRRAGEADAQAFMRKGIVGDWRNCFTDEACSRFKAYAGNALIKLGYESDRDWSCNRGSVEENKQ